MLELLIFERIYEWIDAAAGEDCNDGEVVEGTAEVRVPSEEVEEEVELVPTPTEDEAHADDDQGLHDVVLRSLV